MHRLGQVRAVTVYRLIAEGTCEEHILRLAQGKVVLNDTVLREGDWEEGEEEQGGDGKEGEGDIPDLTPDLLWQLIAGDTPPLPLHRTIDLLSEEEEEEKGPLPSRGGTELL